MKPGLFSYLLGAFPPTRRMFVPVLPPLAPKNIAHLNFPSHGNFWEQIQDPNVLKALSSLNEAIPRGCWPQTENPPRINYLPLTKGWAIEVPDHDMDWTDLDFLKHGVKVFQVHCRGGGSYQSDKELGPLFRDELVGVIFDKIAEFRRLEDEVGHDCFWNRDMSIRIEKLWARGLRPRPLPKSGESWNNTHRTYPKIVLPEGSTYRKP